MSPRYILTYFQNKGRAEPIRLLLAYGRQEFQENFIDRGKWPQLKSSFPLGKLPILEVDGKVLHQSVALCRYFARKFGLAGSNDEETLQIDIIVDTAADVYAEMRKNYPAIIEEANAALKNKFLTETFPYYASKLETIVEANRGFFVNGKLSLADIYFTTTVGHISHRLSVTGLLDQYPNLNSLQKKVFEEPNIKAWLAKREPIP